ncbi:MAG: DUF2497 domain-containing protein [Alphaproteobacteria bacterium]|jgi:cell pole-organizing protein PopZ|nr:DUF2497 domain-containing protein [Alphaproteobacteria bacterium]
MAEIKTEQEPSIEEILESIRQIISEDGTPVDAATAAAKPAKPAESIAAPVPPKPKQIEAPRPVAPPPPARPEPILDLTERVEPPKPAAPRIVLEESPEEEEVEVVDDADHLLSDNTADAAVASLARLLANNMSVERELPGRPGNVTLEDMTREVLKPLLRQWLDQNLQHIIEKMVAREIERLSLRALEK